MLCVRIDGGEVETTPALLARLVFEGKADRHTPTRLPERGIEQPLELSLEASQSEALSGELHRRLQMMCSPDSSAVDLQELCAQVERLCQWRWANPAVAARFFWTAGWLNELAGRSKSAIDFYEAFLLMPSREAHLRLLALNNKGVLRIGMGRRDGIPDVARAAIWAGESARGACAPSQFGGLPAACFNLLNLINVSFGVPDLLRAVDDELTGFFSGLPEDVRASWLGGNDKADAGARSAGGGVKDAHEPNLPSAVRHPPSEGLPILRDPTYWRLNALVTRLAAQAQGLAGDAPPATERASAVFRRLSLWDGRPEDDRLGPQEANRLGDRPVGGEHYRYAEAASLLLSDDIPSLLTGQDDPLTRVERTAQEELAVIEGHLASGRYELAESRLHVQRQVLASLTNHAGLAALLARVDALIERASQLQTQEKQLALQKACAGFVREVEHFSMLTDLGQAQAALDDMRRRWRQFQSRLAPEVNGEAAGLLEELASRSRRHIEELKRIQIETLIVEPYRHVRENRPVDGSIPVPVSVYQALAQCRLHDSDNWIEDWAALQEQLDTHQGRYHLARAISAWRADPIARERVDDDLTQALLCDPALWLVAAPLFGLKGEDSGEKDAHDIHPPFTFDDAGRLLTRTLRQIGNDARKCLRLWECVEETLSPVLAGRDVAALTRAQALAQTCLDHWPAGLPEVPGRADPRNPVNRFLEAWNKARCLAEAQRWLEAQPPQGDEAMKLLTGLLGLGLDTREQLLRAVTSFYLAQFRATDLPALQRQVLAGLEEWVEALAPARVPQIRGQAVIEEMARIRESLAGEFEPPLYRQPDGPAPKEREFLPSVGRLGDHEGK